MKILGLLLVVLLVGYWGYTMAYPSGTFRYKLTLVVDDNGKQIMGSSVREVHAQVNPRILPDVTSNIGVKGEAVVVDLGEKGVFFALLNAESNNDYGYWIAFDSFLSNGGAATAEKVRTYNSLEGKKQLSFEKLPMLVRFRNINDQTTIEKIDPYNLEAIFGSGVRLVGAIISITQDSVTWGEVEKWLPWFDKWQRRGGTITGKYLFDSPPLPETIVIPMNFIQG